jgi:hypothetical protein
MTYIDNGYYIDNRDYIDKRISHVYGNVIIVERSAGGCQHKYVSQERDTYICQIIRDLMSPTP